MKNEKILLIIEDEQAIARFLRSSLEGAGWDVLEARTGRLGLELAASRKPDAILLDLGLPDGDGLDVLKELRRWTSAPVIIISARGKEQDKILGLDAGADDYLTKPFGVAELMARLRVALRHAEQSPEDAPTVYEHDGLKVDLVARRIWRRKKEIHLSPIQFDVLGVLVRHAGRVVSHDQLMKQVWGETREVTPESVRIFIHQLRHKIESDPVRPRSLKTEAGVGYRLEAPLD
jgi:two-component system KDP operon response regulator KdpE